MRPFSVVKNEWEMTFGILDVDNQERRENMTGRELCDKLHYIGMERAVRKLALEQKMDTTENIALMSIDEVCNLVAKDYELVYRESDKVGLVHKDKMEEYVKLVKVISR